jgi:hypothetical protein
MGTCWNCNTQINLGEERTKCDVCGSILFYHCNSCGKKFEIADKKTKRKLKECKLCGYFICPECGVCSWSCAKYQWEKEVLKILRPEITIANCPTLMQKVKDIIKYFEEEKGGNEQRVCPERGVLISYAKGRIKNLLAKVEGFRVKNEKDRDLFLKRLDEITKKDIGTELKISDIREEGSYGQEYRDAFQLLVCLGKLKIVKKIFQKEKEVISYEVYVRCEKEPCKLLSKEDLIINECKEKKHIGTRRFPLEFEYCPTCRKNGELVKLNKRLNDKDTCQLYRGSFIKKVNDGESKRGMGKTQTE